MDEGKLKGKKVAILTSEMYEDLELWYPYFRMKEEGAEVEVVSMIESPLEVMGRHYYPLKTDKSVEEARAGDYQALIVPGGYAPDMLRRSEEVLDLVRAICEAGKPVGALCQGSMVLAAAGVLKGKKASAKVPVQKEIEKSSRVPQEIKWQDQDLTVDGNIITARTKQALPDFSRALLQMLSRKFSPR
ncbi:MAG: protease [Methanotrichaceae archaeon]|nr:protease [Methanotrichaceae archaeon]